MNKKSGIAPTRPARTQGKKENDDRAGSRALTERIADLPATRVSGSSANRPLTGPTANAVAPPNDACTAPLASAAQYLRPTHTENTADCSFFVLYDRRSDAAARQRRSNHRDARITRGRAKRATAEGRRERRATTEGRTGARGEDTTARAARMHPLRDGGTRRTVLIVIVASLLAASS